MATSDSKSTHKQFPRTARRALRWTRVGMVAERLTFAFWPFWSVIFAALGAVLLGLPELLGLEAFWAACLTTLGLGLWSLWRGWRRFVWPSRTEAQDRLDATLPGRPLTTLLDTLAIGGEDPEARAVWQAHRARMLDRAATAKAVSPGLKVARFDPFALRYVAVLLLAVGVLFGSFLRVGQVGDLAQGTAQAALGPSWEGWAEPPRYTGLPTIYLPDVTDPEFALPKGSNITLRLYGEVGALTVFETVSAVTGEVPVASAPIHNFTVNRAGEIAVDGPGGRVWRIAITPDLPPIVTFAKANRDDNFDPAAQLGEGFRAQDDYAVVRGAARIDLLVPEVDRRHGLRIDPEPRAPLELDLPMTIAGDRSDFTETLIDDLSEHPWANLPVSLTLEVEDDIGQRGVSDPKAMRLPGRRFFDPLAKAVIEQRRDLLWSRENALRIGQILRAIDYNAGDLFRTQTSRLRLTHVRKRIETLAPYGISDDQQAQIAKALWDLAIQLEEGDLADAAERLRRAQERLQEAIENGATDEEIAQLMQELREAMQDYMQQLAESQDPNEQSQPQNPENMQEMTQSDLQEMLDRLQELMEQGRMAEAQELLQQLQQMMENMQVTQGQQGSEGQQSPGQQAIDGLAETLRNQQGLSDEAFRDLQDQFNPNGQGQQQGEGQQGDPSDRPGGQDGPPQDGDPSGSLADRQQQLQRELDRQRNSLPGAGTEEGDAARDALDRAGRAMENAEEALRDNDLAEAIDDQAEAMEALREGMQNLAEQMQQDQQQAQGQQGQQSGNAAPPSRDPLGRDQSTQGPSGSDENLLPNEDVQRRAEELLDEIRRRSAQTDRSTQERDYLRRLLDRF